MKAIWSEEYYKKNWSRFLARVPGKDYINLEDDLAQNMKIYENCGIPADAMKVIEKKEATVIVNRCLELVKDEMKRIASLEAGRSSMGYTTQSQEISARADLRKRFEFNCLQLREFREKYDI